MSYCRVCIDFSNWNYTFYSSFEALYVFSLKVLSISCGVNRDIAIECIVVVVAVAIAVGQFSTRDGHTKHRKDRPATIHI